MRFGLMTCLKKVDILCLPSCRIHRTVIQLGDRLEEVKYNENRLLGSLEVV